MAYNKQAIILLNQIDRLRDQQEQIKFILCNIDDSEGTRLLMSNTMDKPFYRARYMNPDALAHRAALFSNKRIDNAKR